MQDFHFLLSMFFIIKVDLMLPVGHDVSVCKEGASCDTQQGSHVS